MVSASVQSFCLAVCVCAGVVPYWEKSAEKIGGGQKKLSVVAFHSSIYLCSFKSLSS